MSLQVWLPLTKDLKNQGLVNWNPVFQSGTTVTYVNGKIGKALNTGGIIMPANITKQILNNNEFSYACWIYPNGAVDSTSERDMIFGNNNGRQFSLFQYPTSNDLHWSWANYNGSSWSSNYGAVLTDVLPSYQWTHIAIVYNKNITEKIKIYINGVKQSITAYNFTSTSTTFEFDTQLIHNSSYHYLNDIRLYNHALSQMEVKELAKGLVLHYPLNRQGWGQENNISISKIINRGCSNFTYNSSTNEWTMTCPTSSSTWGVGITISDTSIKWKSGESWVVSMEVYVPKAITWNHDINNKPDVADISQYTGNDYDDQRLFCSNGVMSSHTLKAGWNKIWFTQRAPSTYGLYNYSTNFGVVTTNESAAIDIKIKNIKGEIIGVGLTVQPTPWCPNSSDELATTIGLNSTTEYDCSGFNNNGTKTNLTYSSDSPRYAVSSVFSGNSYIAAGTGAKITDHITVNLWIKYTTWGNPISCTEGGGWNFENNGGYISFPVYIASVGYKVAKSTKTPANLADNKWHMLTGTFDRTNLKIYIDGVLEGTTATGSTNGIGYHASNGVFIGAEAAGTTTTPAGTYVTGNISDVRIYATALSVNDVLELYKSSAYVDNKGNVYGYEVIEQ